MTDALRPRSAPRLDDQFSPVVQPGQAKKRRRCFNTTERLAAAYLKLGLVPQALAKTGTAKEICRKVEADHNLLHSLGGTTAPQNCNLLPQSVHAEKTKRDIGIAAKSKRQIAKVAEFHRKLFAKTNGLQTPAPQRTAKGNLPLPCGRHSGWKKPLGSFISTRRER